MALAVVITTSCGEDSRHFKVEGHLLQMNQGEFYVYSTEDAINGIDTIKVEGGRFAYEMQCDHPATITLVFPNFSVIPIFAEPGKTVNVNGDASHLKELEIKGTKANEQLSAFRKQTANASPPEIKHYAAQLIADHPESVVGPWLVRKYFIATPAPDYKEAQRLVKLMMAHQKENGQLTLVSQFLKSAINVSVGSTLPTFTAYDINGKMVSSSDLSSGTAVICVWASWSYGSMNMLRQLKNKLQSHAGNVKVVAVSVDASKSDCRRYIKMNQIEWPVVCTGDLFETSLLKQLGMMTVPDNILIKNGKIVARNLPTKELVDRLD